MFFKNLFLNASAVSDAIGEIAGEVVSAEAVIENTFTFVPANFVSNLYYMAFRMNGTHDCCGADGSSDSALGR